MIRVKNIDKIYVFCSDSIIENYLISGVTFLQRLEYLDTQEATPQNIIGELMKLIDSDIYAVCHCTSPFVTTEHIGECIEAVQSGKYDSSFTGKKIQKLIWTGENIPLNFTPDCVPRTQDLELLYEEVSAAYVFRKEVFVKLHRRVGLHPYITQVSGRVMNFILLRMIKKLGMPADIK